MATTVPAATTADPSARAPVATASTLRDGFGGYSTETTEASLPPRDLIVHGYPTTKPHPEGGYSCPESSSDSERDSWSR
jgi:hypothetical protein